MSLQPARRWVLDRSISLVDRIYEIIFWQLRGNSPYLRWTINLDEYNSLLEGAPHLQNPRWDAQDAAGVTLPPFECEWERYNPFKPPVNIVNHD